jgi:hypothetical protein
MDLYVNSKRPQNTKGELSQYRRKRDIRNRVIASTYYFIGLKIGTRVEDNNIV